MIMTHRLLPAWPYPRTVAHRGAGKLAPENTLAAFRLGASFGYTAFEFDVKLSADSKSFLLHDDTLDRTTCAFGRADGLTFGELAQLDAGSWHSPTYAGEPLPALASILRVIGANHFGANVEIKPMPGHEWRTGAAVAIDVKSMWSGQGPLPLLSSFSEIALEAAREAVPELPRALLVDVLHRDWVERLQRLDCVALDCNHRELSREVVARAHAEGFRVLCYTVNDSERAQTLFDWGVDTVITDAVDQIRFIPAQEIAPPA